MQVIYLCFCSVVLIGGAVAKKLPSFVQPCPKSVKDAGDCILKNIDLLKPRLGKGIPELALPPLNPLELPKATLDTGSFIAGFTDIKLYHLDDFQIKTFKFNLDTLKMEISIVFPLIPTTSKYNVKGKLLILEVDNAGDFSGNFTNTSGNLTGTGTLVDKNGKKYIKIEDLKIHTHQEAGYMYFDKIFGDNEELSKNTNKVVNDNMQAILEEFLPVADGVIQQVVIGIANMLFNKYSFDELFLDS